MSDFDKENEELENEELENEEVETEDVVEEAIEKAVGEAEFVDSAESVVEEGMRESFDADGIAVTEEPTVEYAVAESGLEDIPVRKGKGVVIAVIVAIIVALLAGAGVMCYFISKAPYNYLGYINVSGRTVQDIADLQGGSLEDFLDAYSLPADMPSSTDEAAAYYSIPTGVIAEMYGMDFASFKVVLEIPETISGVSLRHKIIDMLSSKFNVGTTIDENTPWGITEGELTLAAYVGEDQLDEFKQTYGFGDEVTLDTRWKEVRAAVDKAALADRIEAEKGEADAEIAGGDDTDVVPEDGTEVVPEDGADVIPADGEQAAPAADAAPAAETAQAPAAE